MKKLTVLFAGLVIGLTLLVTSCPNRAGGDDYFCESLYEGVTIIDPYESEYKPIQSDDTIFYDRFEGESVTSTNPWDAQNASLTTLEKLRSDLLKNIGAEYYEYFFEGKNSQVLKLSLEGNNTSYIKLQNLNIQEASVLTFRYFVCGFYNAENETVCSFKVYLNDDSENPLMSEIPENNLSCFNIKTVSYSIPAGTNSITFEAQNSSDSYWSNCFIGAYIDDISLVKDKVSEIIVTPKSAQKTYIDCPAEERIPVKALAVRADGTVVKEATITFSPENGTIEDGCFVPSFAGNVKITASCSGKSASSGEITIYENNQIDKPCIIAGVTYNGVDTETGEELCQPKQIENQDIPDVPITLELPKKKIITADGFIRFKGALKPFEYKTREDEQPVTYNKVVIAIYKGKEKTIYVCDQKFDIRIWLPFSGEHLIVVGAANVEWYSYKDADGQNCEGDLISCSWLGQEIITATNIHTHTVRDSGANDGRYVYPSFFCQSDNFMIQNMTNEVLYGLPSDASEITKFQAIHDYIVRNYYYDNNSLSIDPDSKYPYRKKQDALSVYKNKMCVCAGDSALTVAMARAAGIPAKYVTSEEINHAWNHIRVNGKWYFCDTTWDDPDKSPSSKSVYHFYFLLTNYNGIRNDHPGWIVEEGRSVAPSTVTEPELPLLVKEGNWF